MKKRTRSILLIIDLIFISLLMKGICQPVPPDYTYQTFKSGFSNPVGLDHPKDGSNRIFVVEQAGRIKIIKDGNILTTPFLDISTQITSGGERGLLGLAFHPNYISNGYFFVHFTDSVGDSRIVRYTRNSINPDLADATSRKNILHVDQPYTNHNAGAIRFGPDGYLYVSMGDGGSGGDPENRSQNTQTLLGKMLRIDIDQGARYSIPPDNPFVGNVNVLDEIWALGLRNPWQFSFDRLTGDIWIGDVGQDAREEINFQPAASTGGENYGWRCYEGDQAYNTMGCGPIGQYVAPVFVVKHHATLANSIAGGYVYRGPNLCLQGIYFCAETRRDTLYTIVPDGTGWRVDKKLQSGISSIVAFGEDEAGNLYAISHGGTIYIISGADQAINGNPIAPGTYTSRGSITSSGHIQTGTVEFQASESIDLLPLFEVASGGIFNALIQCIP